MREASALSRELASVTHAAGVCCSLEILTATRAECAAKMNFFEAFKLKFGMFTAILVGTFVVFTVFRVKVEQSRYKRAHGSRLAPVAAMKRMKWSRVWKPLVTVATVAYPGMSQVAVKVFKCVDVEGVFYLEADMRIECFTPAWSGAAVLAVVVVGALTIGLPVVLFVLLFRKRQVLDDPEVKDNWLWLVRPRSSLVLSASLADPCGVVNPVRRLWQQRILLAMCGAVPVSFVFASQSSAEPTNSNDAV